MSYAQAGRVESPELTKQAAYLSDNYTILEAKDYEFASSLLQAYSGERGVTEKQAHWINVLADRARHRMTPQPTAAVRIDLTKINQMFASAETSGLKRPHILLHDDAAGGLRIARAGDTSRYVGQLMISSQGSFGNRNWYGRINHQGEYVASELARSAGVIDNIFLALVTFAKDPQGVAKAYGQRFGICCFCSRELTDQRSVDAGYGPICADKYGLAWGQCEAVHAELVNYGDPDEAWPIEGPLEPKSPVGDPANHDLRYTLAFRLGREVHTELEDWVLARIKQNWTLEQITDRLQQVMDVAEGLRN